MAHTKSLFWIIVIFMLALPSVFSAGTAILGTNFSTTSAQSNVQNNQDLWAIITCNMTGVVTNISSTWALNGAPTVITEALIYNSTPTGGGIPGSLYRNFTPIPTTFTGGKINVSGSFNCTQGRNFTLVYHSGNVNGNNLALKNLAGPGATTLEIGGYGDATLTSWTNDGRDLDIQIWFDSQDYNYSAPGATPANLTITARDFYDGKLFANFSAFISRGLANSTYQTTNGTITITNL